MRVVHLTAEYFPYARTGGLAEAVAGLARYQQLAGVDTSVILPFFRSVREQAPALEPVGGPFTVPVGPRVEEARLWRLAVGSGGPTLYAIEHRDYFDREGLYGDPGADYPDNPRRFGFFAKAALRALPKIARAPLVLHCHDWHTALAPLYLRGVLPPAEREGISTVLSVHNPGYQGYFSPAVVPDLGIPWALYDWQRLEWYGQANFLKGGIAYSDLVVTVSPTHAEELRTDGGGFGLHQTFQALGNRLIGILNGIDQSVWTPSADPEITAPYSATSLDGKRRCKEALQRSLGLPVRPDVPLFGFSGRLAKQKGLDLILGDPQFTRRDAQFVFLGMGDPYYAEGLATLARTAPDEVAVLPRFTDRAEHRILAGADLLLMPSEYEPCGLTQMRAQRYGTLPVARRVGGLADTVDDGVTGFLFDDFTPEALDAAMNRALAVFRRRADWELMMRTAMAREFGWEGPAERYIEVYRRATALAAARSA